MTDAPRSARHRRRREAAIQARPIRVEEYPAGQRTDLRLPIYQDALANLLHVPFAVVRGLHPGPVVGIAAAVHGDELNGIKIIHNVLERADPQTMHGSLLCAPVVNVPAFQAGQRRFPEDDRDLNHGFPGKADGTPSQQYARAFLRTFLEPLDYLVDIHTASEGRVNSLYVRADLHQPRAREMALLMQPQIILHGRSGDGTLRNAARVRGISAITVEAGNPSVFQGRIVHDGEWGVFSILNELGIVRSEEEFPIEREPVICKSSKWLRTRAGGLLEPLFGLRDRIEKKQLLARIIDPLGHLVEQYYAPNPGIVIGMSKSPVAVPGTRYCHLGVVGEPAPKKGRGVPTPPPRERPAP
jgi:predicted deacylase